MDDIDQLGVNMRIEKIGKVRLGKDGDGKTVIINHDNVSESIEYINQHNIRCVKVDEDYEHDNIDFLSDCLNIDSLTINNRFLKDFSGAYYLKNMKTLAVNNLRPSLRIDFDRLSTIEDLYGELPSKVNGLEGLKHLKSLGLWKYKTKNQNLEEFSNLRELKSLELIRSNITSLKGIDKLTKLDVLGFYYLKSLNDIEDIRFLSDNLIDLKIENCKAINNFVAIGQLKVLEELKMLDCGDIPSLGFIRGLTRLNTLVFAGTNILDGDLTPGQGIDYVYFTEKKHYSHPLNFFTSE
jgi:hypothetical protein